MSRCRGGVEGISNPLDAAGPLISTIYVGFRGRGQNGQMSRFAETAKSAGLPEHGCTRHTRVASKNKRLQALSKKREPTNTGADYVTSISYLPATFTTLFSLAAALLLGLIQ